jgi:hypothetical protein
MMDEDQVLDGNAAAGLLEELLPFEVTMARTACAGCGAVGPIGAMRVYVNAPGTVIRCVSCGNVQLRVVQDGGRYWLDMRGVACIELERPPA